MFDGREDRSEYVKLEGILVLSELLISSCLSAWID